MKRLFFFFLSSEGILMSGNFAKGFKNGGLLFFSSFFLSIIGLLAGMNLPLLRESVLSTVVLGDVLVGKNNVFLNSSSSSSSPESLSVTLLVFPETLILFSSVFGRSWLTELDTLTTVKGSLFSFTTTVGVCVVSEIS